MSAADLLERLRKRTQEPEAQATCTEAMEPSEFLNTLTKSDAAKVGEVIDNGRRYAARVDLFVRIGLSGGDAEELAQRLAWRDQDFDHRKSCAECKHLAGWPGGWMCTNWRHADIGGASVPGVFVLTLLQDCPGCRATH